MEMWKIGSISPKWILETTEFIHDSLEQYQDVSKSKMYVPLTTSHCPRSSKIHVKIYLKQKFKVKNLKFLIIILCFTNIFQNDRGLYFNAFWLISSFKMATNLKAKLVDWNPSLRSSNQTFLCIQYSVLYQVSSSNNSFKPAKQYHKGLLPWIKKLTTELSNSIPSEDISKQEKYTMEPT